MLVSAVVGYQAWSALHGAHPVTDLGVLVDRGLPWLIAAVVAGPFFGLLGGVARTGNILGTLARLFVPLLIAAEVVWRLPLHAAEYSSDATRAWTTTALLVLAVLGGLAAVMGPERSSQ